MAPPTLTLSTAPTGASVTLERYDDLRGRKVAMFVGEFGKTPLQNVSIEEGPGSFRLTLRAPGRVEVQYPLLLAAGEQFAAAVALPAEQDAPQGYAYVPPGRFLRGSTDAEELRKEFLGCSPLHEAKTEGFWIARTEVTFGEWITFLRALPDDEVERRLPAGQGRSQSGMWSVRMERSKHGWRLALTLNGRRYTAEEGSPSDWPRARAALSYGGSGCP